MNNFFLFAKVFTGNADFIVTTPQIDSFAFTVIVNIIYQIVHAVFAFATLFEIVYSILGCYRVQQEMEICMKLSIISTESKSVPFLL